MNNNSSKSIILSVIGVAILVVAVVGVSFAFFTYLGTAANNTVDAGTIMFNSTQSGLNLTNQFPRDAADPSDVARISISGSTTNANGINFRVVLTAVSGNTGAILPDVAITPVAVTGTNASKVTVNPGSTEVTAWAVGTEIATGNITGGASGFSVAKGSEVPILTISAFYNKAKYHISDNTLTELQGAGLLTGFTGTVVKPATWNALPNFTFSFRVIAEEA